MNNLSRSAASFAVLMGVLMLATWIFLLVTGYPALYSEPFGTALLLIGEFLTAFSLIAGGLGLLSGRKWGMKVMLVALGMLLYCVIFSTGSFGQQGILPAAAWFLMVALATLFVVGGLIRGSGAVPGEEMEK